MIQKATALIMAQNYVQNDAKLSQKKPGEKMDHQTSFCPAKNAENHSHISYPTNVCNDRLTTFTIVTTIGTFGRAER